MNPSQLSEQMKQTEERFNQLNQLAEQIKSQLKQAGFNAISEVEHEMVLLQGEFRALDKVNQATPHTAPGPETANVIEAKPEEPKNAKRPKTN